MSTSPSAPALAAAAAAAAANSSSTPTSTAPTGSLEIDPDDALTFSIQNNGSKCVMSLRNNGTGNGHMAFKVKTTQPRRYLVRPNQGLIGPSSTEDVTILLVDKDRLALLKDYEQIGPASLEGCKDKFLVQCAPATEDFVKDYASYSGREKTDALTAMWGSSGTRGTVVSNKKLQVRHVVGAPDSAGGRAPAMSAPDRVRSELSAVPSAGGAGTNEQINNEMASLRKKYDELVAFSVNLTAERDVLNNTLEQTKRDLNRETAARMSAEQTGPDGTRRGYVSSKNKGDANKAGNKKFSVMQLVAAVLLFFIIGRLSVPSAQECIPVVKDEPAPPAPPDQEL